MDKNGEISTDHIFDTYNNNKKVDKMLPIYSMKT